MAGTSGALGPFALTNPQISSIIRSTQPLPIKATSSKGGDAKPRVYVGGFCGDFDDNEVVDAEDIQQVASRWNTSEGDPGYDPTYDLDNDGDIDVVDIMLVAAHWGETC